MKSKIRTIKHEEPGDNICFSQVNTLKVIAWHSKSVPVCRDRAGSLYICAQLKIGQQVQCVKRALGRTSETQSVKQAIKIAKFSINIEDAEQHALNS